jgi:hypothetical protein
MLHKLSIILSRNTVEQEKIVLQTDPYVATHNDCLGEEPELLLSSSSTIPTLNGYFPQKRIRSILESMIQFLNGRWTPLPAMTAEEIFRAYVRQIGIGGIAMAGIIGILRSSKVIGVMS